ncbi:Bug family tripartite tricarboxylate transporter substrate binding protein [Cupriavidus sp. 2TAF22]|uniref:Bug family tripartite tricarboxylate transporter substrate binding protein n=1 Tax=unclassified Cupriavidus TaxID=2640874 RepID=UPI003F8DA0BD
MEIFGNEHSAGRRAFGKHVLGLAAMGLCAGIRPALAALDPGRPVSIIVPTAPGATTDIMARAFARHLTRARGQAAVVENKTGATGAIGAQFVARAAPDGHTLLIGPSSTMVVNPLVQSVQYSTLNDFRIVGLLAKAETLIVANPAKGFRNLQDVIRYAKQNPGKLTYGSSGTGSVLHMAMEYLQLSAGIEMMHVPYKGTVQAEVALLSNEIDVLLTNTSSVEVHIRAGKLVPLAITSSTAGSELRGVPRASGAVPGYSVDTWLGVYVPARAGDDTVATLNAALNGFLADPASAGSMKNYGLTGAPGTPAEALQYQRAELGKWSQVVAAARAAGRV